MLSVDSTKIPNDKQDSFVDGSIALCAGPAKFATSKPNLMHVPPLRQDLAKTVFTSAGIAAPTSSLSNTSSSNTANSTPSPWCGSGSFSGGK